MSETKHPSSKARLIGINHVDIEVGDIDEALAFYGRLFEISLRGRSGGMAFVDMGDQFLALAQGRTQTPDEKRHFGLVVDDKEAVRRRLEEAGAEILPGRSVEFRDPWGNRVQVVEYREIQFTKDRAVLEAMGCADLGKSQEAIRQLTAKGIVCAPGD